MIINFDFQNLGSIKSGGLELNNLTVLCGKNNTGKTYVNYAVYGFLKDYNKNTNSSINRQLLEETEEKDKYKFDMQKFVDEGYEKALENWSLQYKNRLNRVFNVNKKYFNNSNIKINFDKRYKEEVFETALKYKENNFVDLSNKKILISKEKEEFNMYFSIIEENEDISEDIKLDNKFIAEFLLNTYINNLFFKFDHNTFMLPAERSGLNLFFRELNVNRNDLIFNLNESVKMKSLMKQVSKYSLPVSDYINFLNQLSEFNKLESEFSRIADYLEKDVIQGTYTVDKENAISFILDDIDKNNKIDLHVASSTAKTLFGLDYYLRHNAKKGDVLIIDEPELNLHPDNQRKIARVLVMMVNEGIKVMVSTHSDYIIKEFNNLIMLGRKFKNYEELMNKYGYDSSQLLNEEDISAYVLNDNSIQKLELDTEGILVETFDNVINSYNESSDDIYFSYMEEQNE